MGRNVARVRPVLPTDVSAVKPPLAFIQYMSYGCDDVRKRAQRVHRTRCWAEGRLVLRGRTATPLRSKKSSRKDDQHGHPE